MENSRLILYLLPVKPVIRLLYHSNNYYSSNDLKVPNCIGHVTKKIHPYLHSSMENQIWPCRPYFGLAGWLMERNSYPILFRLTLIHLTEIHQKNLNSFV